MDSRNKNSQIKKKKALRKFPGSSLWHPSQLHHLNNPSSPHLPLNPLSATATTTTFPFSSTSSSSSSSLLYQIFSGNQIIMKLVSINPKLIFGSKKSRSVSRSSNPSSFASAISSASSDSSTSSSSSISSSSTAIIKGGGRGGETPKSVLPSYSQEISGDWSISDISTTDIQFDLVQAFNLIDSDGDGKITTRQVETLLTRLGAEPPSQEDLLMMLSEVDPDGDGCISLEEFGAISSAFGPACISELRDAFEVFDSDGDGKISAEELFGVFTRIGDNKYTLEDCQRMINGVDRDGDGFVCFEDFSRMMEQQCR